jgi:hypothetical protein
MCGTRCGDKNQGQNAGKPSLWTPTTVDRFGHARAHNPFVTQESPEEHEKSSGEHISSALERQSTGRALTRRSAVKAAVGPAAPARRVRSAPSRVSDGSGAIRSARSCSPTLSTDDHGQTVRTAENRLVDCCEAVAVTGGEDQNAL